MNPTTLPSTTAILADISPFPVEKAVPAPTLKPVTLVLSPEAQRRIALVVSNLPLRPYQGARNDLADIFDQQFKPLADAIRAL